MGTWCFNNKNLELLSYWRIGKKRVFEEYSILSLNEIICLGSSSLGEYSVGARTKADSAICLATALKVARIHK